MDKLIEDILSTRRAHNSAGELKFAEWLHGTVKGLGYTPTPMAEGCVVVQVGDINRVLFSCHIDTVHSVAESNGQKQQLFFDDVLQHIFLGDKSATCLGADDGAGIYVMLKMIEAKKQGTYIFHRGEERGGIGAYAMLKKHPEFLEKFDSCIAFDRPNTNEVIITQGGRACASLEYGKALATALNEACADFKFETSTKGVFTDSKVYAGIIPECVNLGVGYTNQHGADEYLNWEHLQALTAAAIKLEWSKLPIKRLPFEEPTYDHRKQKAFTGMSFDDFERSYKPANPAPVKKVSPLKMVEPELTLVEELLEMTYDELVDYLGDADIAKAIVTLRVRTEVAEAKASLYEELFEVAV